MNENTTGADETQWDQVFQQAVQLYTSGQFEEAAARFAALVEQNPTHFPSLHRLAAIRRHQGRLEESLALLKQAIGCNPSSADTHNSLGNTLNALGRKAEALDQYRYALALRPDFPEAHFNLGNSFKDQSRWEEAAREYAAAIALRPQFADAHNELGVMLNRLNRPQEAIASYTAALSIDPSLKVVYNNLGGAFESLNRHEEAIPIFQRCQEIFPDAPQAVFNESLARLSLGDYERAWPGYEIRWQVPELKVTPRDFSQPRWDGQTDIAGKTIFLHAEQGLGDMILFSRFIAPVVERGPRVILGVQKPLTRLMELLPGVHQVLTYGAPVPEFDTHIPFGSLPLAFNTTLSTIPAEVPYLRVPPESPATADFSEDARLTVGLCWAGNPDYPADHNRSIPLSVFAELLRVPGVHFVSLQQNLRSGDDQILAGFDNVDLASDRKGSGLHDTAALISKLDLVITIDTVISHLTGALGCRVWVLLPFHTYWAWLRHRTDSPWYPTARLFRQSRIGDWEEAIQRTAAALREMAESRAVSRTTAERGARASS